MSTTYVTREPMTLDKARAIVVEAGAAVEKNDAGHEVWRSPGGSYVHPGVPADYVTIAIDHDGPKEGQAGVEGLRVDRDTGALEPTRVGLEAYPTESHDGTDRVMIERYGRNDASFFEDVLDLVSEHDEEYDDLVGAGV